MNNSKLLMESASPGQNTLVMNQINQLTVMDSRGADLHNELHQKAVYQQDGVENDGQSDSNIDYEGLTESQLLALQEQQQNASQQDFDGDSGMVDGAAGEDDEEDDVIDVDNPEDLAKKGLRRIQIEGDEQEYLLDGEGNIYNLQGEFVGTTGDDAEEMDGEEMEGELEEGQLE